MDALLSFLAESFELMLVGEIVYSVVEVTSLSPEELDLSVVRTSSVDLYVVASPVDNLSEDVRSVDGVSVEDPSEYRLSVDDLFENWVPEDMLADSDVLMEVAVVSVKSTVV